MKRSIYFIAVILVLPIFSFPLSAQEAGESKDFDSWAQQFKDSLSQEEPSSAGAEAPPQQPSGEPRAQASGAQNSKEPQKAELPKLVETNMGGGLTQPQVVGLDTQEITSLERRVDGLEREVRNIEDRMRTMDRTLDDLRRRR